MTEDNVEWYVEKFRFVVMLVDSSADGQLESSVLGKHYVSVSQLFDFVESCLNTLNSGSKEKNLKY